MASVSYRATFHQTPGIALRTPERRVFFADDATGVWHELFDADAPALTLLGKLDVMLSQQIADGPGYAWVIRKNTEHARQAA